MWLTYKTMNCFWCCWYNISRSKTWLWQISFSCHKRFDFLFLFAIMVSFDILTMRTYMFRSYYIISHSLSLCKLSIVRMNCNDAWFEEESGLKIQSVFEYNFCIGRKDTFNTQLGEDWRFVKLAKFKHHPTAQMMISKIQIACFWV